MAKFRVVHGRHHEGGRTYKQGEIVDSKTDLSRLNAPNAIKFEKVAESIPVTPVSIPQEETETVEEAPMQELEVEEEVSVEDDFETMKVAELKQLAEAEEIDLDGATRKADIIERIREALS